MQQKQRTVSGTVIYENLGKTEGMGRKQRREMSKQMNKGNRDIWNRSIATVWTYNALMVNTKERMKRITENLKPKKGEVYIGIQGTKRQFKKGQIEITREVLDDMIAYDFKAPTNKYNQPAGIMMMIPKWKEEDVSEVRGPTGKYEGLKGRVGLVNIKGEGEVLWGNAYCYCNAKGNNKNEDTKKIWYWLEENIKEKRANNVQIGIMITVDANARIGSMRRHTTEAHGGMNWKEEKDEDREYKWIGEEKAEDENENGTLLREFAERNRLIITNTWNYEGSGWTWKNNTKWGRVDYVLVSENLWRGTNEPVKRGIQEAHRINEGLWWKMQDHIPIGTRINWTKYRPGHKNENKIDKQTMNFELKRNKEKKIEYAKKCGLEWRKRGEERDEIVLRGDVGKYDAMADEIMMKIAEEMWPKQEAKKKKER